MIMCIAIKYDILVKLICIIIFYTYIFCVSLDEAFYFHTFGAGSVHCCDSWSIRCTTKEKQETP